MRVVLASSNPGKLKELNELLADDGFSLVAQDSLGIEPAVEDGLTFVENALKKARHASKAAGMPAIADDSGIAADALGGAPGIYSARYAGADASDADNNAKLVAALADTHKRAAHYYCVIVFLRHAEDPAPILATGSWHGSIIDEPRGSGGFGYDPHFLPVGSSRTAAELSAADKHAVSHRGQAVRSLREQLRSLPS